MKWRRPTLPASPSLDQAFTSWKAACTVPRLPTPPYIKPFWPALIAQARARCSPPSHALLQHLYEPNGIGLASDDIPIRLNIPLSQTHEGKFPTIPWHPVSSTSMVSSVPPSTTSKQKKKKTTSCKTAHDSLATLVVRLTSYLSRDSYLGNLFAGMAKLFSSKYRVLYYGATLINLHHIVSNRSNKHDAKQTWKMFVSSCFLFSSTICYSPTNTLVQSNSFLTVPIGHWSPLIDGFQALSRN